MSEEAYNIPTINMKKKTKARTQTIIITTFPITLKLHWENVWIFCNNISTGRSLTWEERAYCDNNTNIHKECHAKGPLNSTKKLTWIGPSFLIIFHNHILSYHNNNNKIINSRNKRIARKMTEFINRNSLRAGW